MVRNAKRVVLVLLAVLSVAGLPAVGFGVDADRATGRASASGPLTTTELLTTTEALTTTDLSTTTDAELTTTASTTTTTVGTTATTTATTTADDSVIETTTTDDSLVETTTLSDSVTNDATEATDETGELVNGTGDSANDTTELADATNDSVAVVTNGTTDATAVSARGPSTRLSVTATSSLTGATADALVKTAASSVDGVYDEAKTTESASGGAPVGRGDRTTEGDATTTTASAATDRESGTTTEGYSAGTDAPPNRPGSGTPPNAPELAAGVGAMTAAALLPQLVDGLALVGNAGLVSASSAFVAPTGTRVRRGLRSRFDRFWRFVTPFRYSRWDDSDPLDHEGREALYEAIERSPGAYLSEVCESADVPVSTARHHLDVLEDEGVVTTAKVRGKRRFYPGQAGEVELTAALADEGTAPVLHALARLGDSHGGRLADELDRDPSTVSHHLSRLEDAGLVDREREGRAVLNRLAPEVRRVLRGDEESKPDESGDAESPAIAD